MPLPSHWLCIHRLWAGYFSKGHFVIWSSWAHLFICPFIHGRATAIRCMHALPAPCPLSMRPTSVFVHVPHQSIISTSACCPPTSICPAVHGAERFVHLTVYPHTCAHHLLHARPASPVSIKCAPAMSVAHLPIRASVGCLPAVHPHPSALLCMELQLSGLVCSSDCTLPTCAHHPLHASPASAVSIECVRAMSVDHLPHQSISRTSACCPPTWHGAASNCKDGHPRIMPLPFPLALYS
jgi:hypothetical protein